MTDSTLLNEITPEKPAVTVKPYYNRLNQPPQVVLKSEKPTRVQESPLDARSPQEVLDYHGMYKDRSYYESNPDKLYLDLTQFDDYETYLNKMNEMRDKFAKLPIDVRARFNHDLVEFSRYVTSSDFNIERLMDDNLKASYDKYQSELKLQQQYAAVIKQQMINDVEKSKSISEQQSDIHT